MPVLVDYICITCSSQTEEWMPSPPSSTKPCPACGGEAKRLFAPVGLMRGAKAPSSAPAKSAAPLCLTNPDVPGLCHMTPAAGRAWLARARKDNRSLERELASQEAAAKVSAPTLDSVVSHHHHGNHGAHGDTTSSPSGSSDRATSTHSHDGSSAHSHPHAH